jgi:gluconolactonase
MAWEFEQVAGPFDGPTGGLAWDGEALLFSVVLESRILRYDPRLGAVDEFRKYTNRTDGLAFSADGRLYGCQRASRRIISFNADGSASLLADRIDGRFHNQPKDLVVDRRGRIWFSDPVSPLPHSGPQFPRPVGHASVLMLDRRPNREWYIKRMTFDTTAPGGVVLSPDEKTLYVADGEAQAERARELRAYPLREDGTLGTYSLLHTFSGDHRGPHRGVEGMCLDSAGNIVACAGWQRNGPGPLIYIFSPTGRVLETHPLPFDEPMNCSFGDPDLTTLYVTTSGGHLYRSRNTGRRGWLLYPAAV